MTAIIARLAVGEFTPKPIKHDRLRVSARTRPPAIRAFGLLHVQGFGASREFPLGQFAPHHIADLASQFFQIDECPGHLEFLLMFPRQPLDHRLELRFQTAFHCLNPPFFQNQPPRYQETEAISYKTRAKHEVRNAPAGKGPQNRP